MSSHTSPANGNAFSLEAEASRLDLFGINAEVLAIDSVEPMLVTKRTKRSMSKVIIGSNEWILRIIFAKNKPLFAFLSRKLATDAIRINRRRERISTLAGSFLHG